MDKDQLILASQSPRRAQTLEYLGVHFFQWAPAFDENLVQAEGQSINEFLIQLVDSKRSQWHQAWLQDQGTHISDQQLVCCADTLIVLDGQMIGKPDDDAMAREVLTALSGRAHQVMTCVAIGNAEAVESVITSTQVYFRPLTASTINGYIASGEGQDKAGAYGLQGLGGALVDRVEGSVSGVVGMPMAETLDLLNHWQIPHRLR